MKPWQILFINMTINENFFLTKFTEKNGHSTPLLSPSVTIHVDELQRDGPNEVGGYRSQVLENQDILFCYSTFPGKELICMVTKHCKYFTIMY